MKLELTCPHSFSCSRYPIIINQLGDLCELSASPDSPPPLMLYRKAIESAQINYANMHVYPYTYLGHYYYRNRHFKEALASWADASDVISKLVDCYYCYWAVFHTNFMKSFFSGLLKNESWQSMYLKRQQNRDWNQKRWWVFDCTFESTIL